MERIWPPHASEYRRCGIPGGTPIPAMTAREAHHPPRWRASRNEWSSAAVHGTAEAGSIRAGLKSRSASWPSSCREQPIQATKVGRAVGTTSPMPGCSRSGQSGRSPVPTCKRWSTPGGRSSRRPRSSGHSRRSGPCSPMRRPRRTATIIAVGFTVARQHTDSMSPAPGVLADPVS
jgi:hypothetical protein